MFNSLDSYYSMKDLFPKNYPQLVEKTLTIEDTNHFISCVRWQNGFVCRKCGSKKEPKVKLTKGIETHKRCSDCRFDNSFTAGTYFHKSKIPIQTLLGLIWSMTEKSKGLNASEAARESEISRKSAAPNLVNLRRIMSEIDNRSLTGSPLLSDFSYKDQDVMFLYSNSHEYGEQIKLRSKAISDEISFMRDFIGIETVVTTRYNRVDLRNENTINEFIQYSSTQDREESLLTSHVGGISSLFKNWISKSFHDGTDISNLQNYLNEFAFRYNRRSLVQGESFKEFLLFALQNTSK